ncbi:T-complex protein 11-like protein 1 [Sarcoptes scabiei]|nr:T-complex protein 11-like protein 1 [Sarcoptes scabiei]
MIDSENITSEIEKELDIGVLPQFIGREELCINKILKRKKFKYNPEICSKYIGSNYAKCIDIIIKFDNDQIENEIKRLVNSGNLRVESEIIFKVKSFQPSQQYLEGLIDDEILNNLKAITSNH